MERLELIAFLENQIRLLEKALEESDGMMVNVDRHEAWSYIGKASSRLIAAIAQKAHREKNPLDWSEEQGAEIALDPIKNEIDSMKEMVKTLKGEK